MSENENIQPDPEPEDDTCACGDPECASGSFEKALAFANDVPVRVVRQDDEVYVNLSDLGSTVMAAVNLQIKANTDVNSKAIPPMIIAMMNETAMAIGKNIGGMLHEERRYVDPTTMPDTVPEEWLK